MTRELRFFLFTWTCLAVIVGLFCWLNVLDMTPGQFLGCLAGLAVTLIVRIRWWGV